MKRNRWQDNPNGLEPLAAQATDYALHMMRTTGSVPPTVIADTDEDIYNRTGDIFRYFKLPYDAEPPEE